MKLLPALILAASFSLPALAQDAARLEAAQAYAETPVQKKLMADMLSPEAIVTQLRATGMPEELIDQASVIVSEEVLAIQGEIVSAMVTGMAESFSLEEIQALTAFYSSPIGASAMSKMQPFMAQTMQTMGPALQKMQSRLQQRLQKELKP